MIANKLSALLPIALCAFSLSVHAAPKDVTGTVRDSENEPLAGVTVLIKGTMNGTQSDENGKYAIEIEENEVLVFDILGYATQEIKVGKSSVIDVTMTEDSEMLAEAVISVGYGGQSRKDLSGSVGVVRVDDMLKAPVSSFDQALQGRIAGVNVSSSDGQPGSEMNIVIRGANSLTQDNSPLYVIDGFPIENYSTAAVNPDDIESMSVLKDASATAIYGSRGANGVIIIETKKGKVGAPTISYSGTFGVQMVTKKMEMMSAYDYVKYMVERDPSTYPLFMTNEGKTLEDYRRTAAIDWQDRIFRPAFVHMHNLSMRGGTNQTRYSASLSYNDQPGVIINSGYSKAQGRLSLQQNIGKYIKFSANVNYTQDEITGQTSSAALSTSNAYSTYLMYRTWAFRPVVLSTQNIDDLFDDVESGNSAAMNPYVTTMNDDRHQKRTTFMATGKIDVDFGAGFSLNVSGGYTSYMSKTTEFNNSQSYKGAPRTYNSKDVNGSVSDYLKKDWMNENILNYKKEIGQNNRIDALIGFTLQGTNVERYGFENTHVPNESLGLSGLDDGIPYATSLSLSRNTLMSGLFRVNYSYKNKYLLTASFRADGSSKFAKGNRWGYFPSGAIAWKMEEEPWMKKLKWVNESKIRVSAGVTGNNRVGDYSAYPSITTNDWYSFDNGTPSEVYAPSNLGNLDLTWESTVQYDIGWDLAVLDNRISMTIDLYRKNTTDLLLNSNLPYSSGFTTVYKNIGAVRNEGLEFSFSTVNVRTRNFMWTSDFNISFNRSKVLSLSEGEDRLLSTVDFTGDFNSQYLYIAQVGQPMSQFIGYEWAGVYNYEDFDIDDSGNYVLKQNVPTNGMERDQIQPGDIKYVDQNGDGVVNDDDRVIIGRGEPIHTGGFNNNFTYKGFSLNIFFQWTYGNDIMNANRIVFEGNALSKNINQFASYADRWSPENTDSKLYRTNGEGPTGIYSSRTIEDGSFLRLKTLQLSYSLPKRVLSKMRMKNFEIFVSGQNLWTWTKYSGLDPEVSTHHSALTPGFDYSAYARNRIFTGGIKLTF